MEFILIWTRFFKFWKQESGLCCKQAGGSSGRWRHVGILLLTWWCCMGTVVQQAWSIRLLHAGEVVKWDEQLKPGSSTGSKHKVKLFSFFSPLVGKLQCQLSHSINSHWTFWRMVMLEKSCFKAGWPHLRHLKSRGPGKAIWLCP